MTDELENQFRNELSQLISKDCWDIVAGEGSGSIISLDFGEKFLRKKPIDNPHLAEDVRNYKSEYSFLIGCVWRLDSDETIICGAWDDNSVGEKMLEGLNMLIGKKVVHVKLFEPALDLLVEFSGNLFLKVFCDQINEQDDYDNYTFFTPIESINVGNRSKLSIEKINKNEF